MAAVAKLLAKGNASCGSQLTVYANTCCVPAYAHLRERFDGDLKHIIRAFKAVCYLSPLKVSKLKPTATDISSRAAFPLLNSELINGLKSELSDYIAAAEDDTSQVLTHNHPSWDHGRSSYASSVFTCRPT